MVENTLSLSVVRLPVASLIGSHGRVDRIADSQRAFTFLAGTLSSSIYGVSMPGDCPASLQLLLFVCGKHSAQSRTPFRQATTTVRLPTGIGVHFQTGMLFGITTESCSASQRNRVHLRPESPPSAGSDGFC